MFSDGLRWLLWKGCWTRKGLLTHWLTTAVLETHMNTAKGFLKGQQREFKKGYLINICISQLGNTDTRETSRTLWSTEPTWKEQNSWEKKSKMSSDQLMTIAVFTEGKVQSSVEKVSLKSQIKNSSSGKDTFRRQRATAKLETLSKTCLGKDCSYTKIYNVT